MTKDVHIEQVTIDRLSDEGEGIGSWVREDGEECRVEVDFTLPEDVVEVELRRLRKKKTYRGFIKSIVKESPLRVTPRCKHFASCGGCSFQHMPYSMQLQRKQEYVKGLFQGLVSEKTAVYPIMGSPEWGYRNKMEYSFSQDKKGEKFLGLILKDSGGKVFHLEECHLVAPWFAKTLGAIRTWWQASRLEAFHPPTNRGSLRTVTFRHSLTTDDRMVMLTVSGNPDFALKKDELQSFVQSVKEHATSPEDTATLCIVLRIQQAIKGQPTQFYEMILQAPDHIREKMTICGKSFEVHVSPQAFFQPNSLTANQLYSRALELAGITSDDVVYDLYCGIGIFGMCASLIAKDVHAIELSPEGAYDAKINSERLGFHNFHIHEGDVGKILKEQENSLPKPDVVIVDPPRSGLDPKAIAQILKLQPKTIVYVSCNPKTQAANVAEFVQNGYEVKELQPFDQFPQTPHVENIVICKRCT